MSSFCFADAVHMFAVSGILSNEIFATQLEQGECAMAPASIVTVLDNVYSLVTCQTECMRLSCDCYTFSKIMTRCALYRLIGDKVVRITKLSKTLPVMVLSMYKRHIKH